METYIVLSSRKNPYPLHGRSLEIPRRRRRRGGGVLKAKFVEAMLKINWNILWGGSQKKKLPWGKYG